MGKKSKRSKRAAPAPAEQPGSGFGGLGAALAARGLVASEAPATGSAQPAASSGAATGLRGKAVVRQERKGRGGKTVTVIDGAAISRVADVEALAKTMRKALGTGARVEGGKIVLQGDQRTSAAAWLDKQGATVIIGN